MSDTAFDLDDPGLLFRADVLDDPRPLYEHLRRAAPIWELPGRRTFLVSDPALVRDVVGRTDEFSSNLVSLVHRGPDGAATAFPLFPLGDPSHVLAVADPPAHTRHRRLLQTHLSPAAVAELEPDIRTIVDERLTPLVTTGRGDAVAALADVVPAAALCRLLGLPPSDADVLVPLVVGVGGLLDGVADEAGMAAAMQAAAELGGYAETRLAEQRERGPSGRSPLFDAIVGGLDRGEIDEGEALGILLQLFSAGTETTQSLIATTIHLLAEDPERQAALRTEPSLIPEALEDVLREDGPFQFHYRWTTTDAPLDDVVIPAESRVLLMWSAANRERGTGDTERRPPHFAFGRGIHFCIGAAFARLEARVVIEQLLRATETFTLDPDDPPSRRPSIMLRRHARLPLLVEPS